MISPKAKLQRPQPWMSDAEYNRLTAARIKTWRNITPSGCWEWTGFIHWNGYGSTMYRGRGWRIHRLSYHIYKGPIPSGHDVCHTCDNRKCFNPNHLWTGPRGENNRDTRNKGRDNNSQKTHCPRGHAYAEHGEFRDYVGYKGWRNCKACQRGRQRVKKGWPEDLAYSLPPQRLGFVANPNHPKYGKSPVATG